MPICCPQCGYKFVRHPYYTRYDERNEEIRRLYHEEQWTDEELCAKYGLCRGWIRQIIGVNNLRPDPIRCKISERNQALFRARISGKTYKVIAKEFGISYERVRQLCWIMHRNMIWRFWREYYADLPA